MRLNDIMSRDIKTISPNADAAAARDAMRTNRIRHLVVVDGRTIAGIISDRDLGGRASTGRASQGMTVADLMTTSVVTAAPETTVRQAANLLRGHLIGCLIIEDGGKPVGIVTTTDLLELLGRGAERPIERGTRRTLSARGPRRARPTLRRARRG
jgi:acetoin utilization protein AcuB